LAGCPGGQRIGRICLATSASNKIIDQIDHLDGQFVFGRRSRFGHLGSVLTGTDGQKIYDETRVKRVILKLIMQLPIDKWRLLLQLKCCAAKKE
jgi:hypothetical protein